MQQFLRTPKQSRSQETLERILCAAEDLMSEGSFQAATVDEIVRRASTSVGAFYTRFPDKQALFHVVLDRVMGELRSDFRALVEDERVPGFDLSQMLQHIATGVARIYGSRKGVLRAIALHARLAQDPVLAAQSRALNAEIYEYLEGLTERFRSEITHPDPERAMRIGLTMIPATLREVVLFGEAGLSPVLADEDSLAAELGAACYAYLTQRTPHPINTQTDPKGHRI